MGASPQTPGLAALELGSINSLFNPESFSYDGGQPPYPQAAGALLLSKYTLFGPELNNLSISYYYI
jgi:hypothetical protein